MRAPRTTIGLLLLALFASAPARASSVEAWAASASVSLPLGALRAASTAEDPAARLRALEAGRGPVAQLMRAEAHLALEAWAAAQATLEAIEIPAPGCPESPSPLAAAVREAKARIEARADPKAAAERLITTPSDPAWLAQAATWLRAAGAEARAEAVEARLLAAHPTADEARAMAERLGAAGVRARLSEPARALERARNLLEAHDNAAAVAAAADLAKALGPKSPHACELGYIEGKAKRKLRQYRGAQRTLEAARKRCWADRNLDFTMKASLLEARVRSIRGQVRGTRLLAQWMAKVAPEHSYVDDAFAMHIDVLERKGRAKDARAAYHELIAEHPDGDQVPLAAWRLAFDAIRGEDWKAALPHLDAILAVSGARPMDYARAKYWRAQVLLRTDQRAQAKAILDDLVLDPSFYGWMALDRLQAAEPKWVAAWKAELRALREAKTQEVSLEDLQDALPAAERARALVAAGRPEWAEAELDGAACTLRTDAGQRALAVTFDALGLHRAAQMVTRRRQPQWRTGRARAARMTDWRLAYSRPFSTEIRAAAEAAGIEALFLTALSREESTFDPDIVSWAGATGLAQLMPPTAIGAYADVFGGRLDLAKLTEPALNLRLGAHVLGQGLRAFGRMEPLALAAYNGGPGLARRFVPAEALPFDVWVETMTVKETRRYVERVVETWGVYRWLYGAQPFVDLPDEVGGGNR